MLVPAALAAAATTSRPRGFNAAGGTGSGSRPAAACAVLAAVLAALTTPSPLSVSIESVRTTGQLATVGQVTLSVTNNTGGSVRPAFTLENGTVMTAFWQRVSGPAVLGPAPARQYTIVAPSYPAMPSIQSGFQVLAFLTQPGVGQPHVACTWPASGG